MSGLSARLDTTFPVVAWVPKEIVETIFHVTNTIDREGGCYMPQVPCDKLSELPDLILDFAGHEIVLKAEDYVVKSYLPFCDRGPYCTPMFSDIGALHGEMGDNTIVLGS